MSRILVNATSAKHGGARTIVESFVAATSTFPNHTFVIIAGFEYGGSLPPNVNWYFRPKSGAVAMAFSLFGVVFSYFLHRSDFLISLNNINTPLVPSRRRLTYFHQLKALDPAFTELKVRIIRLYLKHSSEPVILQSKGIVASFSRMFGEGKHEIIVAWPGVVLPDISGNIPSEPQRILVPVSSPQSQHKNFAFIQGVARELGANWKIVVTAPDDSINLDGRISNIEFAGILSRDELFVEYRRAAVCLFGSTHETVGLPIFEALAIGTPVVAYDAPYVRAFCDDFGISEGLTLAATPQDAMAHITKISRSSEGKRISATHDFRVAEWQKIFNKI